MDTYVHVYAYAYAYLYAYACVCTCILRGKPVGRREVEAVLHAARLLERRVEPEGGSRVGQREHERADVVRLDGAAPGLMGTHPCSMAKRPCLITELPCSIGKSPRLIGKFPLDRDGLVVQRASKGGVWWDYRRRTRPPAAMAPAAPGCAWVRRAPKSAVVERCPHGGLAPRSAS